MELDAVLAPPAHPLETAVDWPAVEATMRTPLPDDYKEFVRRYGTGKIDNFLWVLTPGARNPNFNILDRGERILRAFREYRVTIAEIGKRPPFAASPEPGGLFPWGCTENGDVCYWRTGHVDPNEWRVVLNDGRGSMWEDFDGTMTEFIMALLSRKYVSDILTDTEFPSPHASFQPR
jgi:hypothetical protein